MWRAGGALAVALAAVCDRVLHAGLLGGGAVLVDRGRCYLVLCWGGGGGLFGDWRWCHGVTDLGLRPGARPPLEVVSHVEVHGAVSWELGNRCEGMSTGEWIIREG